MAGAVAGTDPFTSALRDPNLVEKLAQFPEIVKHVADPGFKEQLDKLIKLANSEAALSGDLAKSAEVGQQIAKISQNDPRMMQVLMALQGTRLTVDEKDLRRAEEQGDMRRREPIQMEQLAQVQGLEVAEEAKAKGNEFFKSSDYAGALAHYEHAIKLARKGDCVNASFVATLLSNSAMCHLKLKWPDRAKKAASQAIAVVRHVGEETFDQSKLFYRRALACEQLKEFELAVDDMARSLEQAKKSDLPAPEQQRIQRERARLLKLKESYESQIAKKQKEKENEKEAEVQRTQGKDLDLKAKPQAGVSTPSADYLAEQDFSHWTRKRITETAVGIKYNCETGGVIEVVNFLDQSKVESSITTKRGVRSLYYEMDLHFEWVAKVKEGQTKGVIRVYNIAHDTKFMLGGDENTSYIHQLGWDHRESGAWIDRVRVDAAELFDLIANSVDEAITELRKK